MASEAPGGQRPDILATYRLLRLSLAGLAAAILLSAAVQTHAQHCLLTSISAYWYTPARTVFTGGLVAIGVGLVALRGGTWTENLLLNLAGLGAPLIAVVPTPIGRSGDLHCLHARPADGPTSATTLVAIDNGLVVYAVVGLIGFVLAVAQSARRLGPRPGERRAVTRWAGLAVGAVVVLGTPAWRLADRSGFAAHAHTAAAVTTFAAIIAVVALRTGPLSRLTRRWDPYRDDAADAVLTGPHAGRYSAAYAVLAAVMLLDLVLTLTVLRPWTYRIVGVEVVLLGAFIAFWLVQTRQLGERG